LLEEGLFDAYRDRAGGSDWLHLYQDIITLEGRHAFRGSQKDVALGLIEIYFGKKFLSIFHSQSCLWNESDENNLRLKTGILGDRQIFTQKVDGISTLERAIADAFNQWVINFGKVGYYMST